MTSCASRRAPWCDCAMRSARASTSTSGNATDACASPPSRGTTSSATSPRSASRSRSPSAPLGSCCWRSPIRPRRPRSCVASAEDPLTPRAPTLEELATQLGRDPRTDWAMSFGEREEGLAAAAVPIRDQAGAVSAALSISGPTARLTAERLRRSAHSWLPPPRPSARRRDGRLRHVRRESAALQQSADFGSAHVSSGRRISSNRSSREARRRRGDTQCGNDSAARVDDRGCGRRDPLLALAHRRRPSVGADLVELLPQPGALGAFGRTGRIVQRTTQLKFLDLSISERQEQLAGGSHAQGKGATRAG